MRNCSYIQVTLSLLLSLLLQPDPLTGSIRKHTAARPDADSAFVECEMTFRKVLILNLLIAFLNCVASCLQRWRQSD